MEGALYYYFGIPKNPVNDAMVSQHYKEFKQPPDFFTAGRFLGRHGHRHCAQEDQWRHQHRQAHQPPWKA
jgi:hypothetical protein